MGTLSRVRKGVTYTLDGWLDEEARDPLNALLEKWLDEDIPEPPAVRLNRDQPESVHYYAYAKAKAECANELAALLDPPKRGVKE